MDILKEARALYDIGFATHWIKPNSKAPVKAGWSSPKRDEWDTVEREYTKGYGLGVRLGEASKLSDGYLANIDVDIKSSDVRHREEALTFLEKLFPGLIAQAPIVKTGYGLRLFVKTETPLPSGKLGSSNEECIVLMPTAPINKRQEMAVQAGQMTKAQLEQGYRVRPAWELEFMSHGKQVVLPPSIHPETKRPYIWERKIDAGIPGIHINGHLKEAKKKATIEKTFVPVDIPTIELISRISPKLAAIITEGTGVENRSDVLLGVSISLYRKGFSRLQIASILTRRDYFLGEVAYEHAQTENRAVAAAWVMKYTLDKAEYEVSAAKAFELEVIETPILENEAEIKAQTKELTAWESYHWEDKLERTDKGGLKQTLKNVILILENAVHPQIFKRNEFANRDHYGAEAPWTGAENGKLLTDDDAVNIKAWLADTFHVEPPVAKIFEAMVVISSKNGYHPVRESLRALPPWDGVERLDTWLARNFEAKGPKEYLAQVFRKWLVASVARTFEPGTKFDWMIILQGAQGVGKSMFGSLLFGEEYFNDWLPPLADKDAALGLQGIRCQEFGELDSLRRNEVETIKAFVTRVADKVRPPYGRRWLEVKRQIVFFGTTNRDEYLKDDTGNRRFNPIEVGRLNFDALKRDRDQLWAEAMFIYENGLEPKLYLEGDADVFAKEAQCEKVVSDESIFMIEAIETFMEREKYKPENEHFNFNKFKLTELFGGVGVLKDFKEDGKNIQLAAKALKILGFQNRFLHGRRVWGRGVIE